MIIASARQVIMLSKMFHSRKINKNTLPGQMYNKLTPLFRYQEDMDPSTASPSSSKIVTFAEIAALDRKKRTNARQRVPTGSRRRTYTDELRGLIHTQMSAWEAFLREKGGKSRGTKSVKRLQ